MAIELLRKTLAEKIEKLLDVEVPLGSMLNRDITDQSSELHFDGMHVEEDKLQQCYNFTFKYYAEDWGLPEEKIYKLERMMKTSYPETISDGVDKFFMRYMNIKNSACKTFDSTGMFFYMAELKFSVIM